LDCIILYYKNKNKNNNKVIIPLVLEKSGPLNSKGIDFLNQL